MISHMNLLPRTLFYPVCVVVVWYWYHHCIPLISYPCSTALPHSAPPHAWFYRSATTKLHPFWASAAPLPAPAARGNGPAPWDWNAAVCVCVWVDGRQSVACLHFIYHSLGAVNLHWCLPMTISLPVGLHLLFALFPSSCPAICVSCYKSLCDALYLLHTMSFSW